MATPILQKNLRLFLEANELSGANGSTVSSFTDLSGWNSHLTQNSSLPIIETNSINGKKAVVFDGAKNPLQNSESFTVNSGFLVLNIDEFTNYNGVLSSLATYGILAGKNNTPYFYDFTDFRYFELRVNDRIYPREAAPTPFDTWLLVFFRTWLPTIYDGIQIGRDRADDTRKFDGKIALVALYNREWCESDIRLNTQSIAHSYQLAINNVFPYQGSKSDTGQIGKPHISDNQLEPVIDEKSDRTYAAYDLDFQNRKQSEYKAARAFYLGYYPGSRFIYRDYNLIPPEDYIVRGTTSFEDRGTNFGILKNYGFGVAESGELSSPQIPTAAPAIPSETNDIPPADTSPVITTASLPDGVQGQAYSQAIAKTGGNAPFSWAVQSGALPAGLSLNSSTGVISGTPTTGASYSFTIRVTDTDGDADDQSYSVTVSVPDTQAPSMTQFNGSGHVITDTTAHLYWAAAADNVTVTGYQVRRALDDIFTSGVVTTTLGNVTDNLFTELAPDTSYFWQVRARDAAGNWAEWSDAEFSITTEPEAVDYVLDVISTAGLAMVKAAYSVRKLKNAYAGAAVRVKHADTGVESDLAPGFTKADADALGAQDKLQVIKIYDQTGGGRHLNLSLARAGRPRLDYLNRPVIDFSILTAYADFQTNTNDLTVAQAKNFYAIDGRVGSRNFACLYSPANGFRFRDDLSSGRYNQTGESGTVFYEPGGGMTSETRGITQITSVYNSGGDESLRKNGAELAKGSGSPTNSGDTGVTGAIAFLGDLGGNDLGFVGRIGEWIFADGNFPNADRDVIEASQADYFMNGNRLIIVGDSLAYGANLVDEFSNPKQDDWSVGAKTRDILGDGWDVYLRALSGSSIQNISTSHRWLGTGGLAQVRIPPVFRSGAANNVAVLWTGWNDVNGNESYATLKQAFIDLVAQIKAENPGIKVVLVSMPMTNSSYPTSQGLATYNAIRSAINADMLSGYNSIFGADAYANIAANATIGDGADTSNTTYWLDGLHMTAAGYAIAAQVIAAAVDSIT